MEELAGYCSQKRARSRTPFPLSLPKHPSSPGHPVKGDHNGWLTGRGGGYGSLVLNYWAPSLSPPLLLPRCGLECLLAFAFPSIWQPQRPLSHSEGCCALGVGWGGLQAAAPTLQSDFDLWPVPPAPPTLLALPLAHQGSIQHPPPRPRASPCAATAHAPPPHGCLWGGGREGGSPSGCARAGVGARAATPRRSLLLSASSPGEGYWPESAAVAESEVSETLI